MGNTATSWVSLGREALDPSCGGFVISEEVFMRLNF